MALSTAPGSAAALTPPQYGAGDQCPKCGIAMLRMPTGEVACPGCGEGTKKTVGFVADAVETKDAPWEVKEAANGTGALIIEGYASTWGLDRDGDTIDRKAFERSLPAYLNDNPVLLKDHDRTQVLGRILKAWTDNIGLRIRGEIPKPETGEEAWKFTAYHDIKRGLRRALSVAGVFHRGSGTEKSSRKHIEEVDLYEISNIAVPSQPKALFDVVEEKGLTFAEAKSPAASDESDDWNVGKPASESSDGKANGSGPVLQSVQSEEKTQEATQVAGENESTGAAGAKTAPPAEGAAGAKTVTISEDELKSLRAGHDSFLEMKRQREVEETAEHIANEKMKAIQAEEAKAAAEQGKFYEEVAKAVDARLTGWRSGRKYQAPPSAGGFGAYSGEAKTEKGDSMINLLFRKAQGDPEARGALIEMHQKAAADYGMKAMGEGVGSAGYLVPPQYWQQGIAQYRIAAARVRQLCRVINGITSNLVYIPRETGVSTVGWVSENAPKPSTDQTFGQLAVNIFTLAGISKVSNQLLEDSTPAVDQIVRADLGRLLGQAEDIAFLVGTGAGQPTGIINTAGILSGALGAATMADAIAAAIAAIQANYFGDPEAILINPRHLNVIRTAKDSNLRYIFEPSFFQGADPRNRAFMDNDANLGGGYSGMPSQGGPQGAVWGLPIYSDANLPAPANLGHILVGAFSECYVLERTGVTIDVSSEAGTSFEQNQTWFRGEERLGFTAARLPTAIYDINTIL